MDNNEVESREEKLLVMFPAAKNYPKQEELDSFHEEDVIEQRPHEEIYQNGIEKLTEDIELMSDPLRMSDKLILEMLKLEKKMSRLKLYNKEIYLFAPKDESDHI